MKKCKYCVDLDGLDWECLDEPHHGVNYDCPECGASYYRLYNWKDYACNKQAEINHSELEKL